MARRGASLTLRRGDAATALAEVIEASGTTAVYWNRRYDPCGITQDRRIKADLQARGLTTESFNAALLHEPCQTAGQSRNLLSVIRDDVGPPALIRHLGFSHGLFAQTP